MKKILLLAFAFMAIVFAGCSKDDDKFDYGTELVGKWKVTHVEEDGVYVEAPAARPTYATFNADGSYLSGTKTVGTYKVDGKTITVYIDNELAIRYEILSLEDGKGELEVFYLDEKDSDSQKLKVQKQ